MKKFITIEGIDGVGKSTISKKLAENMGAEFIQTPYFKKHAEKDCEDKFSYYLDDLIQLKSILKEELKEMGYTQFCTFNKMKPIFHEL